MKNSDEKCPHLDETKNIEYDNIIMLSTLSISNIYEAGMRSPKNV